MATIEDHVIEIYGRIAPNVEDNQLAAILTLATVLYEISQDSLPVRIIKPPAQPSRPYPRIRPPDESRI